MIKRLGTLAAACALAVVPALAALAPMTASAATATNTAKFDVTATVASIATISFATNAAPTSSFSWQNTDFAQFNAGYVQADNNPGTISGTFRTSNAGGAVVYFTAPATITGSGNASNVLTVNSVMQFTCASGTYTASGATSSSNLTGGTSTQSSIATGTGATNACANLPSNTSASAYSIPLSLFLNGDALPADTYSTSSGAFVITISAT